MTKAEFAAEMARQRKQAGMTQAQLGKKVHLEATTICRLESGTRNPPKRWRVLEIGMALGSDQEQISDLLMKADYSPLKVTIPEAEDLISSVLRQLNTIVYAEDTSQAERQAILAFIGTIPNSLINFRQNLRPK